MQRHLAEMEESNSIVNEGVIRGVVRLSRKKLFDI